MTLMRRRELEQNERDGISQVWSCGGGVDSVAIAVLIYQGILPRPDYAIMTDNSYDASYTWDYVDEILIPRLKEIDVQLHIIKSFDYVDMDIVLRNGQIAIPAYSWYNGKAVKFRTMCSEKWKVAPMRRWLREQGVRQCTNWVGVSADESRRAKPSRLQWLQFRYPLVEMNLSRRDCKRLIKKAGWPLPLRSACVMCPQKTDNQWLDLRDDYQDDFNRAILIEREMHKTHPNIFLHRSMKPLSNAEFKGGG